MNFEKAIHHCYGIAFHKIPDDGRMRGFPIGKKHGFALLLDGCGVFGCWEDLRGFIWRGDLSTPDPFEMEKPKRQPLRGRALERQQSIVVIGNAALDAGRPLSGKDEQDYISALARVIEAKNG